MKTALTAFGLAVLLCACGTQQATPSVTASTAASRQPNVYHCVTDDGLTVYYSKTSLAGVPLFRVDHPATPGLVDAVGPRIRVLVEGNNAIISASKYVPDLSTTTWMLSVPPVTLVGPVAGFTTNLTQIVAPTSIAGPLPGQHPTKIVRAATCEARFAVF